MKCPVCEKPTDPAYTPFCSRRCADVDLGRWLNESYRVPVEDLEDARDDENDRSDATSLH